MYVADGRQLARPVPRGGPGARRPGRKDGLLLGTMVHCVVHCAEPRQEAVQAEVKWRRGNDSEWLPTEETTLAAVLHAKRAAHDAARADMQASLLSTRQAEFLADSIDGVRAVVDCQTELDLIARTTGNSFSDSPSIAVGILSLVESPTVAAKTLIRVMLGL